MIANVFDLRLYTESRAWMLPLVNLQMLDVPLKRCFPSELNKSYDIKVEKPNATFAVILTYLRGYVCVL